MFTPPLPLKHRYLRVVLGNPGARVLGFRRGIKTPEEGFLLLQILMVMMMMMMMMLSVALGLGGGIILCKLNRAHMKNL